MPGFDPGSEGRQARNHSDGLSLLMEPSAAKSLQSPALRDTTSSLPRAAHTSITRPPATGACLQICFFFFALIMVDYCLFAHMPTQSD